MTLLIVIISTSSSGTLRYSKRSEVSMLCCHKDKTRDFADVWMRVSFLNCRPKSLFAGLNRNFIWNSLLIYTSTYNSTILVLTQKWALTLGEAELVETTLLTPNTILKCCVTVVFQLFLYTYIISRYSNIHIIFSYVCYTNV